MKQTSEKPLRILMLGFRGFPNVQGGIECHVQHLAPLLVDAGCEVEAIVRRRYQDVAPGYSWRGVKIRPVWSPKGKALETFFHTLLGILMAAVRRPDIVHIHAIGPGIWTPIARLLGLRVVVTHHGQDYNRQKWGTFAKNVLKIGEKYTAQYANATIVISRHIQKFIQAKFGVSTHLISNGVNLPDVVAGQNTVDAYGLERGRYVLLVSRLVPEKNHWDIINAFEKARLDGWKLVLVGSSDHPDEYSNGLLEYADKADNIVATGFLTGDGLSELFEHAGLFVLPSSHEGLPIALLEALSYGLKALASDIPANLEVGMPASNYFPVGDVDALTKKLQRVACSAGDEISRLEIRKWIAERYNWHNVAHSTLNVYQSVMARDARARAVNIPVSGNGLDVNE